MRRQGVKLRRDTARDSVGCEGSGTIAVSAPAERTAGHGHHHRRHLRGVRSAQERSHGDLPDDADDTLGPSSSRFVGEHDGNMLFLAKGKEPGTVCLAIYPNATDWVIGCGGGSEFTVGGPSGGYTVRPDGAPGPELHREVASNVFTRG